MDRFSEQIARKGEEVGKSYGFNEDHDSTQPAQWWFQDSEEGPVLFTVFYTQACRWSSCLGCNLPSKCSRFHVGYQALIAQVDHLFALPEIQRRLGEIRKFIISNNGSVLDEETFSSTALMYLIARAKMTMPLLSVVAMETRPEYVDLPELEFISRALKEEGAGIDLELAIGFEAFDDQIRNDVFKKGLELERFESFIAEVASFGFSVKCYFMQKPVSGMSDSDAVNDIRQAIDYLDAIAQRFDVRLNMHLNPTYAAAGTPLADAFEAGTYIPPFLPDVARAALHAKGKRLSIFIGLYDEGLAVPGGSFIRAGSEPIIAEIEEFNRTQNFRCLENAAKLKTVADA